MTRMLSSIFGWVGRLFAAPPRCHYFAEAHGVIACAYCEVPFSMQRVDERCPYFRDRASA